MGMKSLQKFLDNKALIYFIIVFLMSSLFYDKVESKKEDLYSELNKLYKLKKLLKESSKPKETITPKDIERMLQNNLIYVKTPSISTIDIKAKNVNYETLLNLIYFVEKSGAKINSFKAVDETGQGNFELEMEISI